MTQKKNLINLSLFVAIFTLLIIVASIFDLQISNILAGSLGAGKYYTDDVMARIIETIGGLPLFAFGIFGCLIFVNYCLRKGGIWKFASIIFFIGSIGLGAYFTRDCFKYVSRFYDNEQLIDQIYMLAVFGVSGIAITGVSYIFTRKIKDDINNLLLKAAFIFLIGVVFYLSIEVIKSPMGRMRYRAMNMIDDFSYFTNWYEVSDAKHLVDASLGVPKDGFKSFPSGHTYSASMSFGLLALVDVLPSLKTKKWKILSYVLPLAYTGLVAIYRIVAGAHYMSDVLVGGTLGFVVINIARNVFTLKEAYKEN